MGLPNFGIYTLSLVVAGDLIAKCLWFRGELKADVPTKEAYSIHDEDLSAAVAADAKRYTQKLVAAVDRGSLKSVLLRRDLDDVIDPNSTTVSALDLADWLSERGIELGEVFYTDYLDLETELVAQVETFIEAERFKRVGHQSGNDPEDRSEVMLLELKVLELEERLAAEKDKEVLATPVSERQKSVYLRVIGALVALMMEESPAGKPYSVFKSQQAIIDAIHGHFGDRMGLSKRSLEDKFAGGKRQLLSD